MFAANYFIQIKNNSTEFTGPQYELAKVERERERDGKYNIKNAFIVCLSIYLSF